MSADGFEYRAIIADTALEPIPRIKVFVELWLVVGVLTPPVDELEEVKFLLPGGRPRGRDKPGIYADVVAGAELLGITGDDGKADVSTLVFTALFERFDTFLELFNEPMLKLKSSMRCSLPPCLSMRFFKLISCWHNFTAKSIMLVFSGSWFTLP